jgi:hypothetical protein
MNEVSHRIRRSFVLPLSAVLVLLVALAALAFCRGTPMERVFLSLVFIPVALVWGEAVSRRVTFRDDGLVIRKFWRAKPLRWEDVTHVGALVMRKKVYLLLTTTRGFFILSNEYERFADLVRGIVARLDGERVEAEVVRQTESPLNNPSNVVAAWVAAAVLAVILYLKVFSA